MQQAVAASACYPSAGLVRGLRAGEGAMHAKPNRIRIALSIAAVAAASLTASAQVPTTSTTVPNQYPPALPLRKGPPPPRLAIDLLREVPIPGPLREGALRLTPEGIEVPLPDGVVVLPLSDDGKAVIARDAENPSGTDEAAWVVGPDGLLRFRAEPDGHLLAERFHRCARKGWRKTWRLRLPAAIPAPPVIVGRRLCFTALDDQAYCLRADNGHRLWAVDLGERVSQSLAVWSGALPLESATPGGSKDLRLDLLLVVPDSGASLIALDPYNGQRLATFTPPSGWFASAPVVLPDDRIAVARKGYAAEEAALTLLSIRSPAPLPAPANGALPYNAAPPAPEADERR